MNKKNKAPEVHKQMQHLLPIQFHISLQKPNKIEELITRQGIERGKPVPAPQHP